MAAGQNSREGRRRGETDPGQPHRQKREGGVRVRRGHALCTPARPGRDV
ncbi:hypothetical protein [Azospirillum melinis]